MSLLLFVLFLYFSSSCGLIGLVFSPSLHKGFVANLLQQHRLLGLGAVLLTYLSCGHDGSLYHCVLGRGNDALTSTLLSQVFGPCQELAILKFVSLFFEGLVVWGLKWHVYR